MIRINIIYLYKKETAGRDTLSPSLCLKIIVVYQGRKDLGTKFLTSPYSLEWPSNALLFRNTYPSVVTELLTTLYCPGALQYLLDRSASNQRVELCKSGTQ